MVVWNRASDLLRVGMGRLVSSNWLCSRGTAQNSVCLNRPGILLSYLLPPESCLKSCRNCFQEEWNLGLIDGLFPFGTYINGFLSFSFKVLFLIITEQL